MPEVDRPRSVERRGRWRRLGLRTTPDLHGGPSQRPHHTRRSVRDHSAAQSRAGLIDHLSSDDHERPRRRPARSDRGAAEVARRTRHVASVLDARPQYRSGGVAGMRRDRRHGTRWVRPRHVHGTLHAPGYSGLDGGLGQAHRARADLVGEFHTYSVDWNVDEISWLFGGHGYHRLTPADVPGGVAPFHQPFYLLVNLAIGGAWPGNDTPRRSCR